MIMLKLRDVETGIAISDDIIIDSKVQAQDVLVARAGVYSLSDKQSNALGRKDLTIDAGFLKRVVCQFAGIEVGFSVSILRYNNSIIPERKVGISDTVFGWIERLEFRDSGESGGQGLWGSARWLKWVRLEISGQCRCELVPVFEMGELAKLVEIWMQPGLG
jgi:hypothetical protein